MLFIILGITVLMGLYMAWTIGANDFANSMADAVGSRAITIRQAVILGALCEFAGSILVGAHVTDTVRKGIVDPKLLAATPELFALGMVCALLACALWLHLASWWGMPVSTTHSIVGAVAGFGIVAVGWQAVEWQKMGEIVASWFVSPVAGGLLAYGLFRLIGWLILGRERPIAAALRFAPVFVFITVFVVAISVLYKSLDQFFQKQHINLTDGTSVGLAAGIALVAAVLSRFLVRRSLAGGNEQLPLSRQLQLVERIFTPLVVLTSCSVAFAHGANDVANAVGPLAAVADVLRSGTVKLSVVVPFWVLSLGGMGIVLGLATYGYRVMATIGTKITQLTPSRGVAADLATATVVLVFSRMKLPVSTTHTIVGAIIGIGLARGLGAIDRKVTRDIFNSWFVTVPAAGVMTVILYLAGRALHLEHFILQAFPR